MEKIAALYVDPLGVYSTFPGVECWGIDRDARKYAGPHRIVAHPPCPRWGRFATKGGQRLGDDDGCFASACQAAWKYGGVIEHPYGTHAFKGHGLPVPVHGHGWTQPDKHGGRSISVDQGCYGHATRKRTWIYWVGAGEDPLPLFRDEDFSPKEWMGHYYPQVVLARFLKEHGTGSLHHVNEPDAVSYRLARWILPKPTGPSKVGTTKDREATPKAFARALLSLARSGIAADFL